VADPAGPPVQPFRWNLAKRSELGRLIEDLTPDDEAWLETALLPVLARVLAYSDDGDLFFVGRSPESLFDYASGLLFDTSWAGRLHLLHYSMWGNSVNRLETEHPRALVDLRRYLTALALDPLGIKNRPRSVTLVDLVSNGTTFDSLIQVLYEWCAATTGDWEAIQDKLHIVGLTFQQPTSPKTWRWQQHSEWVDRLGRGRVKNISIAHDLYRYIGDNQPKMALSYPPWRWGDPAVTHPRYDEPTLQALRLAVSLFDAGRTREQRQRLVTALAGQPAMRYAWFRRLITELGA
jgi:hypothetical protein